MQQRAIVIGAGIAGLSSALALAKRGWQVTVVERDRAARTSIDALATWKRPGAPQIVHSHGFLGSLRRQLLREFPAFYAELRARGACERRFEQGLPPSLSARYQPTLDDEDFVALQLRRAVFEQALHEHAVRHPGIVIDNGVRVVGLDLEDQSGTPAVRGLLVAPGTAEGGRYHRASTFVNATGGGTQILSWLADKKIRAIEQSHPTEILYFTRFYRRHPEAPEPEDVWRYPRVGDLGYMRYGVFPAEDRIFSITVVAHRSDQELRQLRTASAFDTVCRQVPCLAHWVDPGISLPTSEVHVMGGGRNIYRRFVDRGSPLVRGLFTVGDAAVRTNPVYAQGCSLTFAHTHILAEALSRSSDQTEQARALDATTHAQLYPFYRASVRRDRAFQRRAQLEIRGGGSPSLRDRMSSYLTQRVIQPAIDQDIAVRRASRREFHALGPPGEAVARPEIAMRVLWHWIRSLVCDAPDSKPLLGPARSELLRELRHARNGDGDTLDQA